jgi:mutual gliding-motility protein MglA
VDINQKDRTIRVKIVYYGPPLGGKTTNLRVLHERAFASRRGELISINSMQDRTILCDLLPLRTGGLRGYDLKLQLLAVPGQAMYGATRRVVLKGADGVVFVANSASDRADENVRSLEELTSNLLAHGLDPHSIPLVYQFNKRDLPRVTDFDTLQRQLNPRHAPAIPAVATRGDGVLESLSAILSATLGELCRRYRTMELPAGQSVEAWTKQAVIGMFGCEKLEAPADGGQPPAAERDGTEIELADGTLIKVGTTDHLRVKVATPEEAPRPAGTTAAELRSPESLAASYAEASAELGFVVSDLREERDAARVRLEEMRRALTLATESPGAMPVETRLRRILELLVGAGGASGAALRLTTGDATRILPLPPLTTDPLSRTEWGNVHLEALLPSLGEPLVEEAVESRELTDALRSGEPPYEAVVLVPLRSAERLLGLGLLYYDLHATLPSREALAHLGYLARELSGPLEASAAREATSATRRLRLLSQSSAAAVASLLARLPAESAGRRRLDLADVLSPFKVPGVTIQLPPGGMALSGDAPLLRFALASLVHLCGTEAMERGQTPEIAIRGILEDGQPCVRVSGGGRASVLTPREGGSELAEAELSVVQSIVAAHDGALARERDADRHLVFTLRLGRP